MKPRKPRRFVVCSTAIPTREAAARLEEFRHAQEASARAGEYVPQALDVEFPHAAGHGRCCPAHKEWKAWQAKSDDIADAEGFDLGKPADRRDLAMLLRDDPAFRERAAQETACVDAAAARLAKRRGTGGKDSTARVAARKRSEAKARGVDTGSAEYRDSLRGGEGARKRRKRG